jgi:hypothetical protein
MKTIKKYAKRHKFYTVSARLNYFEMIEFRKLQKQYRLSSSETIKMIIQRFI